MINNPTYRVELRMIEPEDQSWLYQWENDMNLWRFSQTHSPFSNHQLAHYIEDALQYDIYTSKQLRLMIQHSADKKVIGCVDLFDFDPKHQRAGIGILIQSDQQQQGYASEALRLMHQYAKNSLFIRTLIAHISEQNIASLQLFKKNGYTACGKMQQWYLTPEGNTEDNYIYQIVL